MTAPAARSSFAAPLEGIAALAQGLLSLAVGLLLLAIAIDLVSFVVFGGKGDWFDHLARLVSLAAIVGALLHFVRLHLNGLSLE